jgi:hypothetical protein
MIIISIILISIIIIELVIVKNGLLYGDRYHQSGKFSINQIYSAFEVLKEANSGGLLRIGIKGGYYTMYILKNQNETEWWFEFVISKDLALKSQFLSDYNDSNKEYLSCNPRGCIIRLNDKKRYYLGTDKDNIMQFLDNFFEDFFNQSGATKNKTLFNRDKYVVNVQFWHIYTLKRFDISTK